MSHLFSPYALGDLQLKNRIAIAPMCQYSAVDGNASDWHLIHLGQLALSGAALLCLEATAVTPEGRISAADLGLWSDENEAALGSVLDSIRKYSAMPLAIQLAHAGRKASSNVPWAGGGLVTPADGGWQTEAPSAIPFASKDPAPAALDKAGIVRVREAFVASAKRAARLGLDMIEVHGAHGYLLHQFMSSLSNRRDDEYGGSLENRLRFPLEVFDAVRAAFPAGKPVGMRISASDWIEGGWDVEQSVALAVELKRRGADFIHVSSGGLSPLQKITLQPGYQIPFAERIRRESGLPTLGVGLITEATHAEDIIATGQADMIALARGMLYNPHWPWHAAAELGAQVEAPNQYLRSQPSTYPNLFAKK
ncbi:MAG TPA: NADH:flavin oxidoreductase/NADH oxidase [Rhodocyclaceae bacterium]|nr:NADH:flavin oxidoreductase/NADH oxidase [Rhodocyclaceae bacterium]